MAITWCPRSRNSPIASASTRESTSKVDVSGTPVAVGGEIERNLMLLIREALQNAIRHAAPRRLSVFCASIPDSSTCRSKTMAWASIRRSTSRSSRQHYGLVGMRERVERLGGEFHLTSSPGEGTQVRLTIPVAKSTRV